MSTRARTKAQGCVNQLEIRLVGMSRSGNHALVNWILAQAEGRTCFLNCAEPGHNPFESARPMDDGSVWRASYPEFDLEAERRGCLSPKDLLIYSHEDCFLGPLQKAHVSDSHDRWVGTSARQVDVLLLRDPFNLFASRLRSQVSPNGHHTALRIWKQHAREFVGERRLLRSDRVLVNYNRWSDDRDYRRDVAAALGLRFSDAGRHEVPKVGAGSSFDGRAFHGRAAEMPVNERWRWLDDTVDVAELFDAETVDYATRIFGDVCSEEFYRRIRGSE